MATIKEIRTRMKSVEQTLKITNAMYLISSSKLRGAKEKLKNTEPYFFTLQNAIERLLRHAPDIEHRYLENEEKRVNAKSIMGMMSLGLDAGEKVTVSIEGADEEEAMKGIEEYLSKKSHK